MTSPDAQAPSLRRIQEWMAARIVGPAGEPTDRRGELDRWLRVPPGAGLDQRLGAYAGGYPARIFDVLAESYPAVERIVGRSAFAALAARFAASALLTSYNLNDAGAGLPQLLAADALAVEFPFLADLAALEWRVVVAFHATEHPPLDPRGLGWTVDGWTAARIIFQPAVALVSSAWPLLDLWDGSRCAPTTARAEIEHVLVRRADLVVRCEAVAAGEALALASLLAGRTLGETAERLARDGADPAVVMGAFSRWMAAGMIAGASRTQTSPRA